KCLPPGQFQHDPSNCGACGHRCPRGATCAAGACHCPLGQQVCGGRCVDPETDTHNCSSCGHDCTAPLGQNGIGVDRHCGGAPGTGCAGGATCIGPKTTYTTAGTCCQPPQEGECCTDSAPDATDGFARCCTPGVDCIDGAACPNGGRHGLGGFISGCCNPE